RLHQGGGLRDHALGGRLLSRVLCARRGQGGRSRHHVGGGRRLGLGFGVRLLFDRYLPHPLALPVLNPQSAHPPAVVDPSAVGASGGAGALARRDERWQIRVRGLHKTFPPQHVLRGVDLDIERGRTNIIIGGSGQGKSVMMKHLMGLLKPDAGQIWVDGRDIVPLDEYELNSVRLKFGMSFQYSALFDSLTVEENVAFPLKEHTQMSKSEIKHMVLDKLASLGLKNI